MTLSPRGLQGYVFQADPATDFSGARFGAASDVPY